MQEYIDRYRSRQEICLESVIHCLEITHATPDHVRMLMACVAICDTSA